MISLKEIIAIQPLLAKLRAGEGVSAEERRQLKDLIDRVKRVRLGRSGLQGRPKSRLIEWAVDA